MTRRGLTAAAVLFMVAWTAPIVAGKPGAAIGKPVGDAELVGVDGKPATLAAVRGKKATILVFTATECPVANSYLSGLNELGRETAEKGVAVVLVCPTDESPAAVAKWATEFKVALPVYLDPKRAAVLAVGAKVTPEAAVLDADGVLRYRGRIDDGYAARLKKNPAVTSNDLKDALTAVLAGQPVRTPTTVAVGCPIDTDVAQAAAGEVTYHRDVAPILQTHCQGCHRPGEVGPFALTSYRQARRWASDITAYTASREMPPWVPAAGVTMKGERKLTDGEIRTLAKWEAAGCPEGDAKDAPPPAQYSDGWKLGKPDLILSPAEDFHLGPTGKDVFRCFVVPTGLTEHRWVIGYDVKPGNPRVVHHTLHFFDATGQARDMEAKHQLAEKDSPTADHGPGYPVGMGVGFVPPGNAKGDVPRFGGVGGWAPGQSPQFLPRGAGWLLPKGADFIAQTHYHRDGKPGTDRTQVGLYFAKGPIDQPWQTIVLNGMKAWERIPAGKTDYLARGTVYLHTDAVVHSVMPHMHLLGKRVKVTLTPAGGRPVVLVDIPVWDYRWQETYWLKEPIAAPAGSKLEVEAVFDNSAANPNNPTQPPKEVTVGEQTTNEMLYAFFGVTSPKTPFERVLTYGYPPADQLAAADGELTPVLERRIGTWDTVSSMKLRDAKPIKLTGKEVVELAAGGKYIKGKATTGADGKGVITLATYDPARKGYRLWLYDSQGMVIEFAGTYDEQAKVLTWAAAPQPGVTARMVWNLGAVDAYDWSIIVTSGDKPVLEINGTMTRKK